MIPFRAARPWCVDDCSTLPLTNQSLRRRRLVQSTTSTGEVLLTGSFQLPSCHPDFPCPLGVYQLAHHRALNSVPSFWLLTMAADIVEAREIQRAPRHTCHLVICSVCSVTAARNPKTNKRTLMIVHWSEQKFAPSNHLSEDWPVANQQPCTYASWWFRSPWPDSLLSLSRHVAHSRFWRLGSRP